MVTSFHEKLALHVIHAKYLSNRVGLFEMLAARLESSGMLHSVSIVSQKDPHEIAREDIEGHLTTAHLAREDELAYFNQVIKPMPLTLVSNVLKHKIALEAAATDEDPCRLHLIVEDDALFNEGMVAGLKGAIKLLSDATTPGAAAALFLGVPSAATPEPALRKVMDTFKFLPCCDSYMMNNVAARAVLQHFRPIRFPTHLQLTYAFKRLHGAIEMQLISPNIFIDGTKLGLMNSNLEINNRLVFNPAYNRLQKMVNTLGDVPPDDKAKTCAVIDELFMAFDYKHNPEYFYLKAKYEAKKGNHDFALALYKATYAMYEGLGTPLTQGSEFMKDFMVLHRELQDDEAPIRV